MRFTPNTFIPPRKGALEKSVFATWFLVELAMDSEASRLLENPHKCTLGPKVGTKELISPDNSTLY